jgi:hopanoid-associated phosphorylase
MELAGIEEPSRFFSPFLGPPADSLPIPSATSDKVVAAPAAAPPAERLVAALVGMAFEARIAAGPGVFVMRRGSDSDLSATLSHALKRGCRSIISFGVAGGLAPHLRPGDWIIASSVIDDQQVCPTDKGWTKRLLDMMPGAGHAPIAGVDAAVTNPKDKRRMHVSTGAATVDIESHLVARLASTHGLNFAAVRVVIDPAHRTVPEAAMAGLRPGGDTSVLAVIRELIASPSQLSGLLRIAVDAYAARSALMRVRRLLGPDFGLAETGKA